VSVLSTISLLRFHPQGRIVALSGFGKLAGRIEIYDQRTLTKVSTIDVHSSYCEWSPDGRFLLTATLSPRLRADNGIKIWQCSDPLMHVQLADELYQVAWKPTPVDNVPQFGQGIPLALLPSVSASWIKPCTGTEVGPPGTTSTRPIEGRDDDGLRFNQLKKLSRQWVFQNGMSLKHSN
jgi:translation initiation factor 2A